MWFRSRTYICRVRVLGFILHYRHLPRIAQRHLCPMGQLGCDFVSETLGCHGLVRHKSCPVRNLGSSGIMGMQFFCLQIVWCGTIVANKSMKNKVKKIKMETLSKLVFQVDIIFSYHLSFHKKKELKKETIHKFSSLIKTKNKIK